MKVCKRVMFFLSLVLLGIGMAPWLFIALQYLYTHGELCLTLGGCGLMACTLVKAVSLYLKRRGEERHTKENISDLERKLFGKVISMEDYRNSKVAKTEIKEPLTREQEKELKFQEVITRMEALRKAAKEREQRYPALRRRNNYYNLRERVVDRQAS